MPIECSHDSGTYAHTKKITVHKEKQTSKNKNNKMLQEHHKKA
jgi:hypothetical protein